jgi:hypothetical protein
VRVVVPETERKVIAARAGASGQGHRSAPALSQLVAAQITKGRIHPVVPLLFDPVMAQPLAVGQDRNTETEE